jgi:hypothetical protein
MGDSMTLPKAIAELEEAMKDWSACEDEILYAHESRLSAAIETLISELKSAEIGEVLSGTSYMIEGNEFAHSIYEKGTLYFSPTEPKE